LLLFNNLLKNPSAEKKYHIKNIKLKKIIENIYGNFSQPFAFAVISFFTKKNSKYCFIQYLELKNMGKVLS